MRRPPQLGQKPRRLHENGTRRSNAQFSHRTRANPRPSAPHVRNSRNSRSTKRGSPPPSVRSAASRKKVSRFSRTTRWRTVLRGPGLIRGDGHRRRASEAVPSADRCAGRRSRPGRPGGPQPGSETRRCGQHQTAPSTLSAPAGLRADPRRSPRRVLPGRGGRGPPPFQPPCVERSFNAAAQQERRTQYSRNARRRGNTSRSRTRLAAALLAMMSSRWHTGRPSTSTRRRQASAKVSIPSGAKTRSRSKGAVLELNEVLPSRDLVGLSVRQREAEFAERRDEGKAVRDRSLHEDIGILRRVGEAEENRTGLSEEGVAHAETGADVADLLRLRVVKPRAHTRASSAGSPRTRRGTRPASRRTDRSHRPAPACTSEQRRSACASGEDAAPLELGVP